MNTDCGVNGVDAVSYYSCTQNRIYQQHIAYRCDKPGTPYSECVGRMKLEIVKICGEGEKCVDGTPYCRSVRGSWEYGKKCEGKNCLILNDTENDTYKNYIFGINYALSSPEGISLYVKKPGGGVIERYLITSREELIDDLRVKLSYVKMPDKYAEIRIDPPKENKTPPVTVPYYNPCIPPDASELRGLNTEGYDVSYGDYSFRIDEIYYIDDYSMGSITLDVMKPGKKVEEFTCTPEIECIVDNLLIGLCWDSRFNEPIVWVKSG